MCEVITPHGIGIWNIYKFQIYDIQFIQPFTHRIYVKHMSKWQTTPKEMSEEHWVVK